MIIKLDDFSPMHTFDCGQCFRWERQSDESYIGVAGGKVVKISAKENVVTIDGADENDFTSFWGKYLDTERDYGNIKKKLRAHPLLDKAIDFGSGIRLLRQEFHETLISFIISQRSSIPKIKSCVARLCELYGEKLEFEGKYYYSFPSVETLSTVSEADYRALGVGYRAPYIVDAVKKLYSGELSEEFLLKCDTATARKELLKVHGVGDKVCDCVLLFSLGKYDLFPSDVWIKRVMEESFDSLSAKETGESLFKEYSGFAQQYLFYWRKYSKDENV